MNASFREHLDSFVVTSGGRAVLPVGVTMTFLRTAGDQHEWYFSGPHAGAGRCLDCDLRRYLIESAGRLVTEFREPATGRTWREGEEPVEAETLERAAA